MGLSPEELKSNRAAFDAKLDEIRKANAERLKERPDETEIDIHTRGEAVIRIAAQGE
jgi:hypothetical protein